MRYIIKLFLKIVLTWSCNICIYAQLNINWEPPFIPITLIYNRENGLSIETGKIGFMTPIGRFSMSYTQQLIKSHPNITIVEQTSITRQDLLIVLRDYNKEVAQDSYYKIKNGAHMSVSTDGKTRIDVMSGMIIIDITQVNQCRISLQQQLIDAPDWYKIRKQIKDYHYFLCNNRFGEVRTLLAAKIKRFYNMYDINRNAVIDELKRYDSLFGVYAKDCSIDWNTLNIIPNLDGTISVSYHMDYKIGRYDKTKPSQFKLELFLCFDSDYRIIEIHERILNKR